MLTLGDHWDNGVTSGLIPSVTQRPGGQAGRGHQFLSKYFSARYGSINILGRFSFVVLHL